MNNIPPVLLQDKIKEAVDTALTGNAGVAVVKLKKFLEEYNVLIPHTVSKRLADIELEARTRMKDELRYEIIEAQKNHAVLE